MDEDKSFAGNVLTAKVYGESGALKDLIERVAHSQIVVLEDIAQFRKDYPLLRQKKVEDGVFQVRLCQSRLATELEQKKVERDAALKAKTHELNQTLVRLESERALPPQGSHLWANVLNKIKAWFRDRKIKHIKDNFQGILHKTTKKQTKRLTAIEAEIECIEANVQTMAEDCVRRELSDLDRLELRLEAEKSLYYGAVGERDVINRLRRLPATYHVINDFKGRFNPPIYNRAENDRIYSIQVDHIVVGPTGIFVVETKNWSEETILSDATFSPIKQVRRAGFVLFVLLNQALRPRSILRVFDRWGDKKISIRNVVVFRNKVPQGQYQFVKLLGIERLNSYITYGNQVYGSEDIQEIVGYLLESNIY